MTNEHIMICPSLNSEISQNVRYIHLLTGNIEDTIQALKQFQKNITKLKEMEKQPKKSNQNKTNAN